MRDWLRKKRLICEWTYSSKAFSKRQVFSGWIAERNFNEISRKLMFLNDNFSGLFCSIRIGTRATRSPLKERRRMKQFEIVFFFVLVNLRHHLNRWAYRYRWVFDYFVNLDENFSLNHRWERHSYDQHSNMLDVRIRLAERNLFVLNIEIVRQNFFRFFSLSTDIRSYIIPSKFVLLNV